MDIAVIFIGMQAAILQDMALVTQRKILHVMGREQDDPARFLISRQAADDILLADQIQCWIPGWEAIAQARDSRFLMPPDSLRTGVFRKPSIPKKVRAPPASSRFKVALSCHIRRLSQAESSSISGSACGT